MGNFFYYPLQRKRYSYHREEDYDIFGERKHSDKTENILHELHKKYCYKMFEKVRLVQEKVNLIVQVSDEAFSRRFPNWDVRDISSLKCQFEVFDLNRDGLIDFREMTTVLDGLGDTSLSLKRQATFDFIDLDGSNAIDFEEFLVFISKMEVEVLGHNDIRDATSFYSIVKLGVEHIKTIRNISIYKQLSNGVF